MSTRTFGFVIVPNFSLIALSACVDPLRLANQVMGRPLYKTVLLSLDGGLVASSDGIQVMSDHALARAPRLDACLRALCTATPAVGKQRRSTSISGCIFPCPAR